MSSSPSSASFSSVTGQRGADGAEAVASDPVDRRRRRALRQPVALEDREAEGVEELRDLAPQRRSAGDGDPDPSAEPVGHLRVDELVGDAPLQLERARDRPSVLPQRAYAPSDAQRPVDDPPLRAGLLGELGQHRRVHLLVDAGHARQDRRPHLKQRVGGAQRVRKERDRESDVRAREVHQAPEVVGERQVEEHQVPGHGQAGRAGRRPRPSRSSCGGGSCSPSAGRSCRTCRCT